MDPHTGRFHELRSEAEEVLLHPEAEIVFTLGELVSIKGQQFRVVDIGATHVILRSAASESTASTAGKLPALEARLRRMSEPTVEKLTARKETPHG